jgi:hypothetical protein
MNKRPRIPVLPSFADFRTRFLHELKSRHKTKPHVWKILNDQALSKRCASLLWPCVNGSTTKFVAMSKKWCRDWDTEIEAALVEVQNLKAVVNVYTHLDNQPRYVELLAALRSDLQAKRGKRTVLKTKLLGRDLDWTPVLHAKEALETLEPFFDGRLPDATLAALLNAARAAAGQKGRTYTAASIHLALKRLQARLNMAQ